LRPHRSPTGGEPVCAITVEREPEISVRAG
jgi:hypothetical protein